MKTIDAIFFRRYPCTLFKKSVKREDSSPATVPHRHTCKSESSPAAEQPSCEPVSSSTDLGVWASVPTYQRIGTYGDLSAVISNEQWLDTLTDLGGGNLVATVQRDFVSVPVDHRGRSSERLGDSSLERLGDSSLERLGDSSLERLGDSSLERLGDSSLERLGDSSLERLGDSSLERLGDSSLERLGDSSLERLGDSSPELLSDSSTVCQTDASASLDTSVDSCEDRLYIHIPIEEETC